MRLGLSLVLGAVACGDAGPPGPPRADVLIDLVHDVMLPAHAELAAHAAALADASTFCTADAPALTEVHAAWRAAHRAFGRTEAFGYGPATDDHYAAALLFWPTRPEMLELLLQSGAPIDASVVAELGATSKGLPAMEAQLFDPEGGDAAALTRFAAPTIGPRRCSLFGLLAVDASTSAAALADGWDDFGGELVHAGDAASRYGSTQAALEEIVNGIIALLQLVDDGKLARPLGGATGGTPQPELVPSPFADDSVAMVRADLAGVASLWRGGGGLGVRDLVVARNAALATEVDAALDAADAAVAAIAEPLRVAVVASRADVQTAVDRMKDLRRRFAVDVAQQLDVTVTLSDNDGD